MVQQPDPHNNGDTVDGRQGRNGTNYYWDRVGPLHRPDARMGFPWTVKNWQKHFDKNETKL